MIKAIIFDFGDVICHFDNHLFLERIAKYTDKSVDELFQLIYGESDKEDQFEKKRITGEFESGRLSGEEFYQAVTELCGLKGMSLEEFRHAFTDIFTPIPSTFELIRRLDKNYTLAMLSNTSLWDFEYGLKKIDVFDLFDVVSASYEVGVMKPGKEIFLDCLDKLKLPYIRSQANFFMVQVADGSSADEVCENLLKQGVIVRSMTSYGYSGYIRVNIGKHEENIRFLEALQKVL